MGYTIYQQNIIDFVTKKYDISDCSGYDGDLNLSKVGTIGMISKVSKFKYELTIKTGLTSEVGDVIYLHELGHAYYGHLEINFYKELGVISDLIKKISGAIYVSSKFCSNILNVCQDIQINSTLLTLKDNFILDKVFPGCTASKYEVEPGLDFREYYEPVIKKLDIKPSNNSDGVSIGVPDVIFSMDVDASNSTEEIEVEELPVGLLNSSGIGDSGVSEIGGIDKVISLEDRIKQFVQAIPGDVLSRKFKSDIIRLFNRKTRSNGNFFYTSIKRDRSPKQLPTLGIVVDVSGSMDYEVIKKILSQIPNIKSLVSRKSFLVTWNTDYVGSWLLNDIPKRFGYGGGTDLSKAITYCANRGCSKVLLISDFDDSEVKICRVIKETGLEVFGIQYLNYMYPIKQENFNLKNLLIIES